METESTTPKLTRMFVQGFKSIGFVDKAACEGADIVVVKHAGRNSEMDIQTVTVGDLGVSELIDLVIDEGSLCPIPANKAARVVLFKSASTTRASTPALVEVIKSAAPGESLKQAAWRQIAKLGAAERAKDSTLSESQAVIKAMDSPEAASLVALYRHPDAHLGVTAFVNKQAREQHRVEKMGVRTWREVVSRHVENIAKADQRAIPHSAKVADAFEAMRKDPSMQNVVDCYEHEQRTGGA